MNVDTINSIEKLEALGFVGTDACLATSLFEYGLVWLDRPDEDDVLFIYPINNGNFDRGSFANDTDFDTEFDWVDWNSVLSTNDMTRADFDKLSIPHRVSILMSHYGYLNVFGDGYWEGFSIKEDY